MARFRPGQLFRKLSSRGDREASPPLPDSGSPAPHTNTRTSPPSTPASHRLPSPPSGRTGGYSASSPRGPGGVRKTRSLPRLRKRFNLASATVGGVDVPEAVEEKRESVVLVREQVVEEIRSGEGRSEGPSRTTSGSETLGEGRSKEQLGFAQSDLDVDVEGEKSAEVSVQELKLEEASLEAQRERPVVVVQEATPDVIEELKVVKEWPVGASRIVTPESKAEKEPPPTILAEETEGPHHHTRELSTDSANLTFSPETLQKVRQHVQGPVRRPSLIDSANAKIVKTLLDSPFTQAALPTGDSAVFTNTSSKGLLSPVGIDEIRAMVQRKIWVKRPGASATLVQIREDDLVDDVREMILRKYANSLGKTFDAPDMTLSIATRVEQAGQYRSERTLGPEEEICRTIDSYYPGGQTVDEALVINVPQRRTPRPSPKVFSHQGYAALEDYRPLENGTDYFPPMPAVMPTAPIPGTSSSHDSRSSVHQQHHHPSVAAPPENHPRSISVLNTGTIPPLPSPGGTRSRHSHRPKYHRQPTSSPTILSHPATGAVTVAPGTALNPPAHMVHRASTRPRLDSSAASEAHAVNLNGIGPMAPPLLTPPASEGPPPGNKSGSNPPTPSAGIPGANAAGVHRPNARPRRSRKPTPEDRDGNAVVFRARSNTNNNNPAAPSALSVSTALPTAAVPPIHVLIVEDNIINLRILEGLMKRLKVRWQTAMNGQIAVDKWKAGGFHLVLMDIQMPVMNGLQAAREIRRLERVNGIGVFGELESPLSKPGSNGNTANGDTASKDGDGKDREKDASTDRLPTTESGDSLFKSPVIIVALTASSLQSDRHEALAAGCNDFLNKPVNLVWLERKVKEWGCMQALIDYDGWRQWKDFAAEQEKGKSAEEKAKEREKEEKAKIKAEKMAKLQEKQAKMKEEKEREKERKKRESMNGGEGAAGGPGGAVASSEAEQGMNEGTAALKSGAQCLKESGFDMG